jgi:tetratricopeptide (TPR) repeat protein
MLWFGKKDPVVKLREKIEKTIPRLEKLVQGMGERLREESSSYLSSFGDTHPLLEKRSQRSFHVAKMLFNIVAREQANDTEGRLDRNLYDWLYYEVARLIPNGEFRDDSMRVEQYVLRGNVYYARARIQGQERQEGRGNDKLFLEYLFRTRDNLENAVLEEDDHIGVFFLLGHVYLSLSNETGGSKTEEGKEFANQAVKQYLRARTRVKGRTEADDDDEYAGISVNLADAYLSTGERELALRTLDEASGKTDNCELLREVFTRRADILKEMYNERRYDKELKQRLDNALNSLRE